MTHFDDEDNEYRARRRARPDQPRPSGRQFRGPDDRRRLDDEDWEDAPAPRRPSRPPRDPRDDLDRWDDEDEAPPDADDATATRRLARDEGRRAPSMPRPPRLARAEDADFYDDLDDLEDSRPRRRYARPGPTYSPRYEGSGCGVAALYLALGGVAVFVLLLLVGRQLIGGFTTNVPQQIRQIVATPTATVFDRGGTIKQIQNLNRLETSRYTIERVIEASVQRGNFLDNFLGDRLLLIASGNVVAGVDMSKLKDSDVVISPDGKSITINLPPSEVFDKSLDNQRTRVYDRQTGILAGEDKDLETKARQEAENTILQAACEDGIMQKAADEAQRSMEQFLRLLKFQEVRVNSRAGTCAAPGQPGAPSTPAP